LGAPSDRFDRAALRHHETPRRTVAGAESLSDAPSVRVGTRHIAVKRVLWWRLWAARAPGHQNSSRSLPDTTRPRYRSLISRIRSSSVAPQ